MESGQGTASDEPAWWSAAQAGDGEAFGRVFDLHHDRVYRHACRVLDVRADAEDVTAAAFLELWRRRNSVRVVADSVLPWLLVTTTNLSRNVRRSTRRHRALLERLPRDGTAADPAEVMLASQPAGWDDALVTHLRGLSRADLALVTLVALEGFTIAEAAAALGLSVPAAKSRLHRVRHRPGLSPHLPPALTSGRSHP
ncbi:MAG: RNA polymerase sigma factor [Terrabacter sp.]